MTTKETSTGERMAKLEANLDNLTKIVTEKFAEIGADIKAIVKEQNNVRIQNVTRAELESEIRRLELNLEGNSAKVEAAITETKRRHSVTVWVTSTLATILSIAVTLLATFFFQNIGR